MKKLSKSILVFASTAMILANGFFVSCSNGDDDDSTPAVTSPKPGAENGNNGGNNNGNDNQNNGGNQNGNDNQNNGGNNGGGNENTGFSAPDLSSYYKKYFVTSDSAAPNFGKGVDTWGSGAGYAPNSDGSIKLTSAHMWDAAATEGVVAAFNDLEKGVLAGYEYIVFTVDTSSFTSTFTSAANDGVNVKLAGGGEKLLSVSNNSVKGENNTVTYYAKISDFDSVPQTANQLALIIGGSGTLVVKEIYAAAASDPALKPVTGITITPTSANVAAGKTATFVVKDSNFVDVTANAVFELSGAAATGCNVSNGVFTAGSAAGEVTLTAKYTVSGSEFTNTATITVVASATTAKELFAPTSEGFKLDGILPLVNTVEWGGTNTTPTATQVNGVDAVVCTVPEAGIGGWGISVAWQGGENDKISLVGYGSISITVKDEFGSGKSLTSAGLKIKGGVEVSGTTIISAPDANGWRTITATLDQYTTVNLGAVTCIHLADWADAPAAGGKLYISKVTLNPAN